MKPTFMLRKFGKFSFDRALPVTMLWLGTSLVLLILNSIIKALRVQRQPSGQQNETIAPAEPLDIIEINTFFDIRLLIALAFGALLILGIFSLVRSNLEPDTKASRRLEILSDKILDEISSAATHIGAILFVSSVFKNIDFFLDNATTWEKVGTVALFFLIGALTSNPTSVSQNDDDRATEVINDPS